ncbi:hypothetical protein LSTR_LSTR005631 [Laodelphax striatellus]|uniref:Uncharacterized protein n=1 Tax=Laodelphax striatellus TaxID=195883 RepID=A0A482WUM0_LAOST|nr:hypothetical protein LSTR_LSTR005631 [Laodelphax striatellus]
MRQDLDDDSTSRILPSRNSEESNESPILSSKRRKKPKRFRTENNENKESVDDELEICLTKKSRTELDVETNASPRLSCCKSTQTSSRNGSDDKVKSFMKCMKRLVTENFDLFSDGKPSATPSSDRAQESSSQKTPVDEIGIQASTPVYEIGNLASAKIEMNWDVEFAPINPEYSISPINSQEINENDNHPLHIETTSSQLDISSREENEDHSLFFIDPVVSQEVEQEVEVEQKNEEPPLLVIKSVFCQEDIPEFDFGELEESTPIEDDNEIICSSSDEDMSILEARDSFEKRFVVDTKNDRPTEIVVNTQGKIDRSIENESIETISSLRINSSSNEESQSLPIDDDDDDDDDNGISDSSSEEDEPLSKTRSKLKRSLALKFQSIANRCRSRRTIWEYQLRAAQDALDRSNWPVFAVKEYVEKFNCSFMRCTTERYFHSDDENNSSDEFSLSNSIYILCDDQNEQEIGANFKIHLPLLLLDHNHETYLLGGSRLELLESLKPIFSFKRVGHPLSVESPEASMKRSPSTSPISSTTSSSSSSSDMSSETMEDVILGPYKNYSHIETDDEMTGINVVVMKNLDAFNNSESLGFIKLGSMLRCINSNPFVMGKFLGWAELPIRIHYQTNVVEDYLVVVRDAAQHNCAFGLSKEEFAQLKSLCENAENKNKRFKLQGFRFTHVLPVEMLPELRTFTAEKKLVEYKFGQVYYLTKNGEWSFDFLL